MQLLCIIYVFNNENNRIIHNQLAPQVVATTAAELLAAGTCGVVVRGATTNIADGPRRTCDVSRRHSRRKGHALCLHCTAREPRKDGGGRVLGLPGKGERGPSSRTAGGRIPSTAFSAVRPLKPSILATGAAEHVWSRFLSAQQLHAGPVTPCWKRVQLAMCRMPSPSIERYHQARSQWEAGVQRNPPTFHIE